jgi:transglutaminase-like putative cysteine protease
VALGRDYDDVSPVSGVLLGSGRQRIDVAVDVAIARKHPPSSRKLSPGPQGQGEAIRDLR